MIEELINPKTSSYFSLKEQVNSADFPWYYIPTTVEKEKSEYASCPYYSHAVVKPPSNPNLYPTIFSPYSEVCNIILQEIFNANSIKVNCIFRINFNTTLPLSKKHSQPHYDHDFAHKNLLIYLNDSDGDTVVCENENKISYSPKEDSVILFEGLHYQYFPSTNRRIVMITTFM